ncbi:hypothetical protein ABZW10_24035 [Kitasatospora sp. NPDC004723]|uniref:hypothetical protein n=1 Tax=Kitasatospora sp. NPDC004723 TaxID=3154288 RepID=UPI0033AE80CA
MTPVSATTPVTATAPASAHRDGGGHPALDGAPVARLTGTLREALLGLAARLDPAGAAADPDWAVCAALRLVVAGAYDTAEPGEEPGLLYVTPPVAELGSRPVWLERARPGGPVTARFPADRC